jgi:hypothetical protein
VAWPAGHRGRCCGVRDPLSIVRSLPRRDSSQVDGNYPFSVEARGLAADGVHPLITAEAGRRNAPREERVARYCAKIPEAARARERSRKVGEAR